MSDPKTGPVVLTTITAASDTPIADSLQETAAADGIVQDDAGNYVHQPADAPLDGAVLTVTDEDAPGKTPPPIPQPAPGDWQVDINAINSAAGDPHVWAHQFWGLIGYTTGHYIDEGSLEEWLQSFATQVSAATYRSVFFSIANSVIPADVKGDPSLQLLQFRDDIARGFKHQAGL